MNFTKRFRPLTSLPGSPAVVIAAHPNKNASPNELIPSGGGSTLNEVDGNLALAMQPSGLIELGWQGKFRGLPFRTAALPHRKALSPDIVDVEGRQIAIPIMLPASARGGRSPRDSHRQSGNPPAQGDRRQPERVDHRTGGESRRYRAAASSGALTRLAKERPKLIQEKLGKWAVTKAGKEALEEAKNDRDDRIGQNRETLSETPNRENARKTYCLTRYDARMFKALSYRRLGIPPLGGNPRR